MPDARRHFHEELEDLELQVKAMGMAVQELFDQSIRAVAAADPALCMAVVDGDDEIDDAYMKIERSITDLLALQTPVATDLRLIIAILHINLHLERIGDVSVNIAKLAKLAIGSPRDDLIVQHLQEMGGIALKMIGTAMECFARRDVELSYSLPPMDDPLDRLNRGMLNQILRMGLEKSLLEWGIRMHVVSRQIERVGDHAVDIGEQVAFLATGVFREFTDASHDTDFEKG